MTSQVVDALQLYLESSNGRFPDVKEFHGDTLMSKVRQDLQLPDFTGDSARWGFSHLTTLQRVNRTFQYRGAGRSVGDGSFVILHWSISEGRHQIILDNLKHLEVDETELLSRLSGWNSLAKKCVVKIGNGTGTVVSSDGLILTANHVLSSDQETAEIIFADGTLLPARIVSRDQRLDAALLSLSVPSTVSFIPIQTVSPEVSQSLWVIGYPAGRRSPLIRNVVMKRRVLHELIVSSSEIEITGGDSGGSLINGDGQLVGIVIGPASARLTEIRLTDIGSLLTIFPMLKVR